jgi:aquaporin Z
MRGLTHPPSQSSAKAGSDAVPWGLLFSEGLGTALLLAVGCSLVIANFGQGSPVSQIIPSLAWRRALTGFAFGSVGASLALSPIGRTSGAHINPIVTLAFWSHRTLRGRLALGYVGAQFLGGLLGAWPLLLWGPMGNSVHYAATLPGPSGLGPALAGEAVATFCLVAGLLFFVGHHALRRFTPALFPALYAWLVWWEAPLSGTSTNPARSLGPALVAHAWSGWWVDWCGPIVGGLIAIALSRTIGPLVQWEVRVAKVYHYHLDPHGVLHRNS